MPCLLASALTLVQPTLIFHLDCYSSFLALCLPLLYTVYSLLMPGSRWPQDICTCCSSCLEHSSLSYLQDLLPSFLQVFVPTLPSQTGLAGGSLMPQTLHCSGFLGPPLPTLFLLCSICHFPIVSVLEN